MSFATATYFIFLPLVFFCYHGLRSARAQNILLVLASYTFYAWWDWRFCFLMLSSTLVDFWVGRAMVGARGGTRRALLTASLGFNLGLLGFFKYFDFFVTSAAEALTALGFSPNTPSLRIILPVGISFYTFQSLSYTLDIYRGRLRPVRELIPFLAFVSFFPQLVAGPIERARRLLPQVRSRRSFDYQEGVDGLRLILWGLVKKMVVADGLAGFVERAYRPPIESGPLVAVGTVLFAFQIYCDFSAYSDIAIGSARLFGIRLSRNFAYPYFSRSVAEFWRRWHISLSTWFRDYVYFSLGGSRQGLVGHVLAVVVTFTVSGLWHGANWTFVIWGLLNGLAVAFMLLLPLSLRRRTPSDTAGGEGLLPGVTALVQMAATFGFICLTWVFFRSESLGVAFQALAIMGEALLHPAASARSVLDLFTYDHDLARLVTFVFLLVLVEWMGRRHWHPLATFDRAPGALRWFGYTVLVWLIILEGTSVSGAFIYFQF